MNSEVKNGIYYVDDDLKLLHYDNIAGDSDREIKTGQPCYAALAGRSEKCPHCPLSRAEGRSEFHDAALGARVFMQAADTALPVFGSCHCVVYSLTPDSEKAASVQDQSGFMKFINEDVPCGYLHCSMEEGYPIIYANEKFLDMMGYTWEELQEKFDGKYANLVHPDDREYLGDAVTDTIRDKSGSNLSIHYRMLAKSGYIRVVDITRVSEVDGERMLQCVIINVSDTEELDRNIESLELSKALTGALSREQQYRKQLDDLKKEVTDSISCGVFAYTLPDYEVLLANKAVRRMIGCADDENPVRALYRFLKEYICPEDRERVLGAGKRLKKAGDTVQQEYSANVCGRRICLNSTVKYLTQENGHPYILVTLLDVTEPVTLMNNLKRERKEYRDALEKGSEFTFLFDATEGLLHERFVTAHGVDLIGDLGFETPVSFDELLAKYVETEGIEFAEEKMRSHFTCKGLTDAFESGVSNLITEFYNPCSDLYFRVSCLLSADDETGHIHAAVVADDVTGIRKKDRLQQEALKAANEEMNVRIDAMLSGISGGFKIADPGDNFRYMFISEGAAALQGYTVDEFLEKFGRSITSNVFIEDKETAFADANRQITENGTYTAKYRIAHKDGSIKWVIDRGKRVEDPITGKRLYYILMQDVTELENRNIEINNVLSMQKQMADSIGSGIFAYTVPEYNVLILNQEIKKMFDCIGCVESEFGKDLFSRIIPEDLESVRAAVKKIRQPGDHVEYIFHSYSTKHELITFKSHTKMLSFSSGQKYIISALTDISEQEKNEKRLDLERRQYRNALTFGSVGFFEVDLTDGNIYQHVRSKLGEDLTDKLGLSVPAKYDDLAALWFSEERIISSDTGEIAAARSRERLLELCENGTSILDIEYKTVADEKYYHLMILLYKIGGHINASFIVYDITSTRQSENQRLAIIDSLGHIFSALYHLSFYDNKCTVLKAGRDLAEDHPDGCSIDRFRGLFAEKYAAEDFKETAAEFLDPEKIRSSLADTEYISFEFKHRSFGWCRVFLVAAERDRNGEVASVVFAGNVIEKQKQADFAQREALKAAVESANMANSAKSQFLANMSHDIRTPMNIIIGMTSIASTHLDDRNRVSDCLAKISMSSKHLLGLINEVLDMSKIESGKMEILEEEFNLSELIDNLLTMSKPLVENKKHELTVSVHGIDHENVIGDSQRIQQVFMNLMTNAIKYTPAGGRLGLDITERPADNQRVGCYEFVFRDNGIGMSEEFQKHIFEPFTRATNDSRIEGIQGTGLGMPITKSIIQTMNGDIKIKSKLNEGTEITVTFFLKLQDTDEETVYEEFSGLSVLVAGDDEESCAYACRILCSVGMKGEYVLSGEEAVSRAVRRGKEGNGYFAVMLDWRMSGGDSSRFIRDICGSGDKPPTVIISAYDYTDIELEARSAGASAFISKPLFKSRVIHLFKELTGNVHEDKTVSALDRLSHEDFSGRRVLLAEDNELNREIAGEILGMIGFEVEFAVNGKEAVDKLSSASDGYYDVIFMDIQMPVMNGYEAARAIRALPDNYARSVPILAMTANAFAEDVSEAKNAGMNAHIAKPLDLGKLLEVLRKWL